MTGIKPAFPERRARVPSFPPGKSMLEVLRSNDAVLLSFAEAVLREVGIASLIADQHISVMEGSIGAFPRRLLVGQEDWVRARAALAAAGLDAFLVTEQRPRA